MRCDPPLRILLAHQRCAISGVEAWLVDLWRTFTGLGHVCEMFFFSHGPMEKQLPSGCQAHFGDLQDFLKRAWRHEFDVVHVETSDWEVGVAAVRHGGPHPKLVVTAQTEPVESWNAASCDVLVGCSEWLARAQQALTDLPVAVVPNGVDTETFACVNGRRDGGPIAAWVGRGADSRCKRLDRFAAVAPALVKEGIRLWIADPDGPHRVAPDVAVALRPLAEFWGHVPRGEMPRFFQHIAASGGCVVSTSTTEGLPFALLEAQSCGCPVIGPATRGVSECVDPVHGGVLYAPGARATELAGLVLETIEDRVGMRWRRKACARYIRERFTLARMAQDYLRIYHEALAQVRPEPASLAAAR